MRSAEAPTPFLQGARVQVFVTDLARSLAFYRDLLGFEVVFTHGEPPFYGEVRRDGARLNLRVVDESPFMAGVQEGEELLSAYVEVTDPEALCAEVTAAGADARSGLRRTPWGTRELIVRDPDGNLLLFGAADGTGSEEQEPGTGR